MTSSYQIFDPLMSPEQADAMVRLCEDFGSYGTYADDDTASVKIGEGLAQRHDAAMNFIRTGGRFGAREDASVLASRTNYFRETYAYGEPVVAGIEPLLHHQGFIEATRKLHGRARVVPNIVYANILVPGQELAVHTDVPEFRGANRKKFPQWLMVVMHHSRLFEHWRMPIATGIAYFRECEGGALAFYPDGAGRPPRTLAVKHNTAAIMDTDTVFHGVDRVLESSPIPEIRPGMRLVFQGNDTWQVISDAGALAEYKWGELRFSVSWKAYAYHDEADQRRAEEHSDDLELDFILDRLETDLRDRGRLQGPRPGETDFALLMIDDYIRFPDC